MNHHTEIPFHQIQLMQNGFHLASISELEQTWYVPKNIKNRRAFFSGSTQHAEHACFS
jgi:hypothetical protein